MKTQYTKDKTNRLSFRVNDALAEWVGKRAEELGVSPCEYARAVLFQQMSVEAALRAVDTKPTVAVNARGKSCGQAKR